MGRKMKKVSVIIPVYNIEDYLERSLSAITSQTLKEIEIIIINDGSTDNSQSIIEKYKGFVYDVSNYENIGDLYIISDMLMTDYSSVFFDYAILKRPIIFYMYDLEAYRDDIRGFYIDLEELPGDIVQTEDEVASSILKASKGDFYDERYKRFNDKFNYLDDGNVSKRIIEKVIK